MMLASRASAAHPAVDKERAPAVAAAVGPHRLTPVPVKDVVIDDAFWAPKRRVWQEVTLRDCFAKFEKDRGGALNNFDKVASGAGGSHAGDPWMDGLVYEMIRGASDFLIAHPHAALERQLEGYAVRIAAAARTRPDGYLNTYTQLVEPGHEWGRSGGLLVWQHEVYNLGALVDAGIHHYRATGSITLLAPAVTVANSMADLMGPAPRQNIVPAHPLPEEALVRLYELFRAEPALKTSLPGRIEEGRYLKLAEFWIEHRGDHVGQPDWDKGRPAAERWVREQRYGAGRPSWGAYAQDHVPVFRQQTIEGHAVRATLLCAGIAAAAHVNDDQRYRDAAARLWDNMVHRRMHITGGVGAFAQEEKFGADFQLPGDAYLETCAAVGAGFFHRNMNLLFGDARYADELERVLYNGALSGVSLKGDTYLYTNPLESGPERERWAWHDCPCCPPMFLKIMGAMPGYVYATDDAGVYVNLYVGSRATIRTAQGNVVLRQATDYPWDGKVRITVERAPASAFDLMLRVPGWSSDERLAVNGTAVATQRRTRGYVRVARTWKAGDVIELDLPMPVQTVRADPRVRANLGRAALMRGPLVYCHEGASAGQGDDAFGLAKATFVPRRSTDLDGAVVLDAVVADVATGSDQAPLYAASHAGSGDRRRVTAIPYYANLNRGGVNMAVWLPLQT